MLKLNISMMSVLRWLMSRVAVIYIIIFVFCLTCLDLKMLEMRIKVRHLNDAIPDFSNLINFSQDQNVRKGIDWEPYKDYFELVVRYEPDDLITKQLLGYVDFYTGQEDQAMALFKASSQMNGRFLFWSNYNLGVMYFKKGMWPQSAVYLFKAISSNPQLSILLMQNSIVYKQIFANPYFKYSINDEITDAQARAYVLLLSCLNNMGQYEKMVLVSNLALSGQNLSYKDAFYYYAGLAFYELHQYDKAYLLFQKSLSLEKDNPDIYYYIGDIYEKAGQLDQARGFIQISYTLHQRNDPRFPYDAHANLRFF